MQEGSRNTTLTFIPKSIKIKEDKPYRDAQGHRVRFIGFSGIATAGQSSSIQYKIQETRWVSGVELILDKHVYGDKINFEIVDVDGIYYSAGTVLDEFGKNWNLSPDKASQGPYEITYWAKIDPNLYIRVVYNSTGQENVSVGVNCYLHKKS